MWPFSAIKNLQTRVFELENTSNKLERELEWRRKGLVKVQGEVDTLNDRLDRLLKFLKAEDKWIPGVAGKHEIVDVSRDF